MTSWLCSIRCEQKIREHEGAQPAIIEETAVNPKPRIVFDVRVDRIALIDILFEG